MSLAGLDLRGLQPGFKAHFGRGLGRLCQGLAEHLPNEAGDLELAGLIQANLESPPERYLAGCPRLAMPQPWPKAKGAVRLLGQEIILPRFLKGRLGLIHFIAHLDAPARPSLPTVVTINDMIMERAAGRLVAGGPIQRLLRSLERRAARTARRVIAVSQYTADEAVQYMGANPDKIRVIHEAAEKFFQPVDDPKKLEAFRARYGLEGDFFLYVGGFDARKNLARLVRAFSRLIKAGQSADLKLALAGGTGNQAQVAPVRAAIRAEGLEEKIPFLGYVPDGDLPALYSLAQALVFPSLYEGFGLPALEAMACGCPVLAARASSLPEVVGPAGLLFDPESETEIAEAMVRLLAEPGLRDKLIEMGFERAAQFSWSRTARQTAAVYREVLDEVGAG